MISRNCFIAAVIISLICVACPYINLASNTDEYGDFHPMWENVSMVNAGLSFSETTANCSAKIVGLSGTTKFIATITLERKIGNNSYAKVKIWSDQSVSGSTFTFNDTYGVTKGYSYRLTVIADVTRNGTTETVSNWMENSL